MFHCEISLTWFIEISNETLGCFSADSFIKMNFGNLRQRREWKYSHLFLSDSRDEHFENANYFFFFGVLKTPLDHLLLTQIEIFFKVLWKTVKVFNDENVEGEVDMCVRRCVKMMLAALQLLNELSGIAQHEIQTMWKIDVVAFGQMNENERRGRKKTESK